MARAQRVWWVCIAVAAATLACETVNPADSFDATVRDATAPPLASVGRLAVIGGSVISQAVSILDLDAQRQVGFIAFNAVVAAIALHPNDRSLWLSFASSPVGPFGIYRVDPGSNRVDRVDTPEELTHAIQLWFSPDGERLYVMKSQDEVFIVEANQPSQMVSVPTADREGAWKIDRIAYSPRGGLAAQGVLEAPRAPSSAAMLLFAQSIGQFVSLVDIGSAPEGPVFSSNGTRILAIDSDGPSLLLFHLASEMYGRTMLPGEIVTFSGKDAAGDRVFLLSNRFGIVRGEFDEASVLLEVDGVSGSLQEIDMLRGVYRSGAFIDGRNMLLLAGPHFPDIRPETTDIVGMINTTLYDLTERRVVKLIQVDSRLEYRDQIVVEQT